MFPPAPTTGPAHTRIQSDLIWHAAPIRRYKPLKYNRPSSAGAARSRERETGSVNREREARTRDPTFRSWDQSSWCTFFLFFFALRVLVYRTTFKLCIAHSTRYIQYGGAVLCAPNWGYLFFRSSKGGGEQLSNPRIPLLHSSILDLCPTCLCFKRCRYY